MSATDLYDPAQRDFHYKGNIAQYLVDLHDADACFKFYGGPEYGNMMFQGGKQGADSIHFKSIFELFRVFVICPGVRQEAKEVSQN